MKRVTFRNAISPPSCMVVVAVAVVLLLLASNAAVAVNGPLPHVVAIGDTPYEVGFQVGRAVRDRIVSRLAEPAIQEMLEWQASTPEAMRLNQTMFEASMRVLPEAIDEMRGIAEGAKVSFGHIWFLNVHVEIQTLQAQLYPYNSSGSVSGGGDDDGGEQTRKTRNNAAHCTEVYGAHEALQQRGSRQQQEPSTVALRFWGHNEDAGPNDVNHTYLVTVGPRQAGNKSLFRDNYTSFAYAASLGGGSFAWNAAGVIFSDNSLFPNNSNFEDPSALPQRIMHRLCFRQTSIAGVLSVLETHTAITAFSFNVGTWSASTTPPQTDGIMFVNIEVDPMDGLGITRVRPRPFHHHHHHHASTTTTTTPQDTPRHAGVAARMHPRPLVPDRQRGPQSTTTPYTAAPLPDEPHHMYHANLYETLLTAQGADPSSTARIAALQSIGPPTSVEVLRAMLGDTSNPTYPVYRTGGLADPIYTLATAVFVLPPWWMHGGSGRNATGDAKVLVFIQNPKDFPPVFEIPFVPAA